MTAQHKQSVLAWYGTAAVVLILVGAVCLIAYLLTGMVSSPLAIIAALLIVSGWLTLFILICIMATVRR